MWNVISEYTSRMDDHHLLQRRERALGPACRLFYDSPFHPVAPYYSELRLGHAAGAKGYGHSLVYDQANILWPHWPNDLEQHL